MNGEKQSYILGLDLGANSLGWAMIARDDKNQPVRIIRSGVRIFDNGMDGDFSSGNAEPYNVRRRNKRLARRRQSRRVNRQRRLAGLLCDKGLLPDGRISDIIPELDRTFWKKYRDELPNAHVIPYWLRARALDEKLEPYELGRALYHLGQRRGFKSNRKVTEDVKKEEKGTVKPEINRLENMLLESGARTLGEYFSLRNPEEKRIRQQYTSREMYESEFDLICKAQATHYPDILTDEFIKELRKVIFFQRPVRSAKGLVGYCELEKGKRRAAWPWPVAQRFRLLQQVSNCMLITPEDRKESLTIEQKQRLIDSLEEKGEIRFTEAKKIIGVKNNFKFAFELGGEKGLLGIEPTKA